jgi:acyl-[acyl-carrier-protein]-phospholipid O-acyltransferase/long-chain-fatty-acid--[acyl-carrier-protein] ligase
VLSHANLVGNARQIAAHAGEALGPGDVLFNPLPVFHSFGLTAGLLVGLFNGMRVVLYPSPLHYRQVPKLIGARRLPSFSRPTPFSRATRGSRRGDLAGVRYVIAGRRAGEG